MCCDTQKNKWNKTEHKWDYSRTWHWFFSIPVDRTAYITFLFIFLHKVIYASGCLYHIVLIITVSLPVSHHTPVYPILQEQMKLFIPSIQEPPFLQVTLWQSSISEI